MKDDIKEGIRDFLIVIALGLIIAGLAAIWNNFTESSWDRAERIYEQRYGDIERR